MTKKKVEETTNDNSIFIPQREKIKHKLDIKQRSDLTDTQKQFLQIASDKECKIIFVLGPAGTAKTYLSILSSLQLLNQKKVSDLLYIRSVVESSDHRMGYLPGDANEKLSPYMAPLLEKLEEILPAADVDKLTKEERIDSKPTGYLRGLNWNAKAIIADECQNMTQKELLTLMTRVGRFSKLFICGDPIQSDINSHSGLLPMVKIFNDQESEQNGIFVFEFTKDDIVRSEIVKYIIDKFERNKSKN